jgi:hypothetical protein
MGLVAAAGAVATVAGGVISSKGAKNAANVQAQAGRDAQAAQERMFERQIELQEPFRQTGITAQNEIMQLLGIGGDASADNYGKYSRDFGMSDFEQDPGYAFRQSEGMKALERSASARGNLLSGSTMKGIQRFGQDMASQEYTNAFNRYQVNRSNQLNPLQSLMGAGQSATNAMTSAAGNFGTASANNIMNTGAARASGYVGPANALSGALSGVGKMAIEAPMASAMVNYYNTGAPGGVPRG